MNAVIVVGGCILLANVLFSFFFYTQLKKKFSPASVLKNIRQEVNRLVKEIDATADRDISILEQRLADIREQLKKADAVIRDLKTAREEIPGQGNRYTEVLESGHEPPISVHAVEKSAAPPTVTGNSVVPPAAAMARYTVARGALTAVQQEPELVPMPDMTVMTEKVLHYTMNRLTPEQIAEKLDISRSEVELILSMTGI